MSDTYGSVKAKIINYIKLNGNDTNLLSLVDDAISLAVYEIARSQKWPELLKVNQPVDLTVYSSTTGCGLPKQFMLVERVRFYNNSPLQNWRLQDRTGLVPPAPIAGKPRAFQIIEGPDLSGGSSVYSPYSILVEPFDYIEINDTLLIDYYEMPTVYGLSPISEGGDYDSNARMKSNMWDAEIEKRAITWLFNYYNKLDQASAVWKTIPSIMRQMAQQQNSN